jgi:hypothetical protein
MFFPLLAIAAPAAFVAATCPTTPSFTEWAEMYGKTYQPTEMDYRMTVYAANLAKINAHNAGNYSWTMAVNKFADLTADEFAALFYRRWTQISSRFQSPRSLFSFCMECHSQPYFCRLGSQRCGHSRQKSATVRFLLGFFYYRLCGRCLVPLQWNVTFLV